MTRYRPSLATGLFALLASLVAASALGQSAQPTNIRITTWNLERFPNGSAREAPQEKQAQRIKAAADVLKELNPDILGERCEKPAKSTSAKNGGFRRTCYDFIAPSL